MNQLPLPGMDPQPKVVNVASVPHRSPFRYPGGKTWFVPYFRRWVQDKPRSVTLVEPFAGGAIVGLTAAFEQLAGHVVLAELDSDVAAVWQTIIEEDGAEWLAEQITHFDLTQESIGRLLNDSMPDLRKHALQTIVRNRINRGGILAPGAGQVKQGEKGKGLKSRWYPQTLAKRIRAIGNIRSRLQFIHGDGRQVIERYRSHDDAVFFIDPPYSAGGKHAGKRLYTHHEIDHAALFAMMAEVSGDFLMTYDENARVRQFAAKHKFDMHRIPMKNTHHAKMMELVIGRNLNSLK